MKTIHPSRIIAIGVMGGIVFLTKPETSLEEGKEKGFGVEGFGRGFGVEIYFWIINNYKIIKEIGNVPLEGRGLGIQFLQHSSSDPINKI